MLITSPHTCAFKGANTNKGNEGIERAFVLRLLHVLSLHSWLKGILWRRKNKNCVNELNRKEKLPSIIYKF